MLSHVIRDFTEETLVPCVKLRLSRKKPTRFSSKIGGLPYLPPGFEYPFSTHRSGQETPLRLLAQLNLAELPTHPQLPRSGMLQFFIDPLAGHQYGLDCRQGYSVVYHKELLYTEQELEQPPFFELPEEEDFVVEGEHALKATLEEEAMTTSDYRFEREFRRVYRRYFPEKEVLLQEKDWDKIHRAFFKDGHKIGGYPLFTQEDPRGRPFERHNFLLLQIDSDSAVRWGRDGVGNFFIDPDALEKLDFSDVLFNWDSCQE